jgi:DNA-binding transcriptional MerR regulator
MSMEQMSKLYYDTNEVAAMVGCEPSALRFWEKKFPQLNPKRDARNRRRYTERDIEVVKKIMHQKDKQGRTIKGAREQLRRKEESQLLIYRLNRVRQFLTDLKEAL